MVGEEEVIRLLRERGKATLEEISSALNIPKYGPNSAYEILYSLKSKNIAERRGSAWVLTEKVQAQAGIFGERDRGESDRGLEKLAKTIKEAMMEQQTLAGMMATKETERARGTEAVEPRCQKTLTGLKTGTFLDSLFFDLDGKPLGGVPASGQFALIGPLGAGKSLLANEIALRSSSERKTLLIVLDDVWESSKVFDLQSRMRVRSEALKLDWERLSRNLHVLNPPHLGGEFLDEYERVIRDGGVDLALLDSVNQIKLQNTHSYGEHGVELADLIDVNRAYGVTGFFVIHSGLNRGEFTHNSAVERSLRLMDCIILVTPVQITSSNMGANISCVRGVEKLRVVQILKCRLCGFEGRGILASITSKGFIKPLEFGDLGG
ncbi:MAG: ATPase domain-containing protein [Candidatus Bathyarchaeia archaeon]